MDLLAPGVRRRAEAESTWSNSKAAHHMKCSWSFVFPSRIFWAIWAPRLWWFTIIFADCLDFLSLLLAVWQFTVEWPTGRAHKGATWGSCFDVVENYPCTNLIACNVFFMQRMLFLLFVMCFFVRARASDAEFCQHVAERRHMDPKRAHQSENQNTKSDPPKWKQIRKVKFLLKAGQKHCSVSIFLPMYQLENAKVL